MIAKQNKGSGFLGTLKYVLEKDQAQLIGGNMLSESPQDLASEFSESRKMKSDVTKCVYHTSLALPKGERLTDHQWNEVANEYMEKMGFGQSQFIVARHKDTEHDHIHIVASRIGLDGKVVSDSHDYKRSETIVRGLEMKFGLTPVTPSHEVERRAPTRGEIERTLKGDVSTKLRMQDLIDQAMPHSHTASDFIQNLDLLGVSVVPNIAKTGHVSGVSYMLDNEQMKGSDLGKKYTWQGIQRNGVHYDQNRDGESISQAIKRSKDQSRTIDREFKANEFSIDSADVRSFIAARAFDGGIIRGHDKDLSDISSRNEGSQNRDFASDSERKISGRYDREKPSESDIKAHGIDGARRRSIGGIAFDQFLRMGAGSLRQSSGGDYDIGRRSGCRLMANNYEPVVTPFAKGSDSGKEAPRLKRELDLILGVDRHEEERRKDFERKQIEYEKKMDREKRALEMKREYEAKCKNYSRGHDIDFFGM